jgi:hypothetical protein
LHECFPSLLAISESLLRAKQELTREMGGHLYTLCFRAFDDAYHRSEVLRALVGHTGTAFAQLHACIAPKRPFPFARRWRSAEFSPTSSATLPRSRTLLIQRRWWPVPRPGSGMMVEAGAALNALVKLTATQAVEMLPHSVYVSSLLDYLDAFQAAQLQAVFEVFSDLAVAAFTQHSQADESSIDGVYLPLHDDIHSNHACWWYTSHSASFPVSSVLFSERRTRTRGVWPEVRPG